MKQMLWATLCLSASVIVSGCGSSSSSNNKSSQSEPTTQVRVAHLSPDAPAVDVARNGQGVLSNVSYRQASGFLSVPVGEQTYTVLAAGTDTAVIDATVNLAENRRYTVLAVGSLANIEPLIIDDEAASVASGFSRVRVVHGAPAAPAVDVYVSAPGESFTDLSPLLTAVPFKGVSDALSVPAGDYRVRVTLAGEAAVIYDSGSVGLISGVDYLLVASEVSTGLSPIGLTALTSISSTPVALIDDARARVRVVHASSDAPEVDVLVNDAAVLQNVPFGVSSGYLELLAGEYQIAVAASASGARVIDAALTFAAQTDYTIAAVNQLASIEPLVLVDDNSSPAAGNIKLRLIHAAVTAGNVDVYVTAPGASLVGVDPLISGFAFKDNSGYVEVPAGSYQVRVAVAGTQQIAIDTGAVALSAGAVRTAFALDPAPTSGSFGALLLEDSN